MGTGIFRTGNSTSLGTGTTRTAITPSSGMSMPAGARALMQVDCSLGDITPTTVQSISAKMEIESPDIKDMMPYEVLFPLVASGLGATFNTFTRRKTWDLWRELYGGETVNVYGTALVSNTVAPEAQAFLVVSDTTKDLVHPVTGRRLPIHAKLGTLTATGTTADTDVPGTAYRFSGGLAITKLFGFVHPKTIAAGDMLIGEIKYSSSEFDTSFNQTLPLEPWSFGLGATGSILTQISERDVVIPLKVGQVTVQDNLNFGGAIGTAGSFIDGVLYV